MLPVLPVLLAMLALPSLLPPYFAALAASRHKAGRDATL